MASSSSPGVDDTAARLLVTPIVGVAVPNLADMVNHGAHSTLGLMATYAWFIGIAYVTWEANLRLYLLFQDRTAWLTRPWHRVRLLIGLICLFTIPFTVSALWLWAVLFKDPNATWRAIAMAVTIIVAAVTFVTHVYETLFLVKEWGSDRERGDELQRMNAEAELLALKSEVNPHTLFNNLHALSHLVEKGHPHASAFVGALANSYRYVLTTGAKRLVPLADELALLDQFLFLATIRYAEGLSLDVHVDAQSAARWQIPPVVLPELLENAVKHNEVSSDNPLQIEIRLEGDRLIIAHEQRPRRATVSSTGVGLDNLAQRFRLTTGVAARWAETGGRFVVTLPLVATDGLIIAK
jgi:two-component system, LytTR family, sensor kinase